MEERVDALVFVPRSRVRVEIRILAASQGDTYRWLTLGSIQVLRERRSRDLANGDVERGHHRDIDVSVPPDEQYSVQDITAQTPSASTPQTQETELLTHSPFPDTRESRD